MASIRRLKKDIDYLTFALVSDSLNCFSSGSDKDEIGKIVQDAIDSRNSLRSRVNAGKTLAKSERKAHYKAIYKDMLVNIDGAFTQLSEVVKKA